MLDSLRITLIANWWMRVRVTASRCPVVTHLDLSHMSLTNNGLEKYCRTKPGLQVRTLSAVYYHAITDT